MNAVVSDQRIGERQHLSGEGGVGQRFLIAHHAGGEDKFARTDGVRPKQLPGIASSIRRQEDACTGCTLRKRGAASKAVCGIGYIQWRGVVQAMGRR